MVTESKSTYVEIKAYVLEKYRLKVSRLSIFRGVEVWSVCETEGLPVKEGKCQSPTMSVGKEATITEIILVF